MSTCARCRALPEWQDAHERLTADNSPDEGADARMVRTIRAAQDLYEVDSRCEREGHA